MTLTECLPWCSYRKHLWYGNPVLGTWGKRPPQAHRCGVVTRTSGKLAHSHLHPLPLLEHTMLFSSWTEPAGTWLAVKRLVWRLWHPQLALHFCYMHRVGREGRDFRYSHATLYRTYRRQDLIAPSCVRPGSILWPLGLMVMGFRAAPCWSSQAVPWEVAQRKHLQMLIGVILVILSYLNSGPNTIYGIWRCKEKLVSTIRCSNMKD